MLSYATADQQLVLRSSPEAGVACVTLNRPASRNALSSALIRELTQAITELGGDRSCAVIIIAANGPVFCSGHDLKELTHHRRDDDLGQAFFQDTMRACSTMMQAIVACPKPVIAAVQGMATAAGCQLVASADLAIAAESASFATPGVNIGLFCSTPMVALSRNVPRKVAMEMLLLGEAMSAEHAVASGLINRAVPIEDVMATALSFARRIAAKSQPTVAIGKAAFYRQIEVPLTQAYDDATRVMVANMLAVDAREGIGAFLEKRSPNWSPPDDRQV
ncbi:MAG: enoyl-CoA hydratase [Hyphomicrobium sp.]|nr:enoyl-CoA hydratase [Hyphomicrobium sp.]